MRMSDTDTGTYLNRVVRMALTMVRRVMMMSQMRMRLDMRVYNKQHRGGKYKNISEENKSGESVLVMVKSRIVQ